MEDTADAHNTAKLLPSRTPSTQPPRRSLVQGDPRITYFNGDGTQNAKEWLQQFERAMRFKGVDQRTEPLAWLKEFCMLFEGEVAHWAIADPVVGKIVSNIDILPIGQPKIMTVKEHFLERYHKPREVQRNPIFDELLSQDTVRKREDEERQGPAHGKSTEQQMQSDVAMSKRPDYTTVPLNQAKPSLMEDGAEHQAESVDALSEGPDYYIVPLTPTQFSCIGELVKREEERRQSVHSEGEEQQTQSTGAWSSGSTAAHAMPKDSCSLVEGTNDEHTPDPDSAIIPRSVLPLAQQTSISSGNSSHLAIRTRSHHFRMLTDGTRYIVKHRGVIKFKSGKKAPTRVNTMLNSAPHEIVSPITPSQLSPYSLDELKRLFTLPKRERQLHLSRGEEQRATGQQKAPESSSKPSETASSNPDIGVDPLPRRPRASTDPTYFSVTHKTATAKKTTTTSSSKSKRAVRRNSQSVNTVRSDGSNSDDDWDSDDDNSEWDCE